MTGRLITYENNNMSLSCKGVMIISNGIVTDIRIEGYRRDKGDEWVSIYNSLEVGMKIDQDTVNKILSFNGERNVVSNFKEVEGSTELQGFTGLLKC